MHSRFAALLLGLGILDLAYINWALGPDVLASAQARTLEGAGAPASATLAAPPEQAVPAPAAPASVPVSPDVSAGAQPTSPEPARVEAARAPEPARVEAVRAPEPAAVEAARAPEPAAVEEPARAEAPSEWILHFTLANTAALPEAAEPLVTEIGRRVRSSPHLRVSIIGHADERGTREHNFELGERRARAVADALIGAGVSPEQLYVESRGEEAPRAVGASEQSWAENRRVEIAIYTQRSQTP